MSLYSGVVYVLVIYYVNNIYQISKFNFKSIRVFFYFVLRKSLRFLDCHIFYFRTCKYQKKIELLNNPWFRLILNITFFFKFILLTRKKKVKTDFRKCKNTATNKKKKNMCMCVHITIIYFNSSWQLDVVLICIYLRVFCINN